MSLLVLYFNPANLLQPDASFEAISDRLIVPPVVETLVYSKFQTTVRVWGGSGFGQVLGLGWGRVWIGLGEGSRVWSSGGVPDHSEGWGGGVQGRGSGVVWGGRNPHSCDPPSW